MKLNGDLNLSDICGFTYDHYKKTLKKIKEKRKFATFSKNSDHDVILRHDIDCSLKAALKMAKIEDELGVTSTYFILFTSEFYNPFNIESSKLIQGILKLGHKLGLHYEESFILQNSLDPTETIEKQIDTLNHHFDTSTECISAHEAIGYPPQMQLVLPKGVENAYSAKFAVQRKYISDSAMYWREGCFCENYLNYEKLQILIHPMWWHQNKKSRSEIMNLFLNGEYDEYSPVVTAATEKHERHAFNCQHNIDD